jgi:putative transcriptional regulator
MRSNAKLPRVLGKRIAKLRKEFELTQEDLAYKIGISRVYMGYIEQGRHTPSWEVAQKIAKILKISLSDLIR